jgi:hypothetical protein
MFALIEISQGIKTFCFIQKKTILENYFKLSTIPWRIYFEVKEFQNTILNYFKSYASIIAKEIFYKIIYIK